MSNKPDDLSRRHDHADIPNPAQVVITAKRFNGFRAETNLDIISEIREAQQEDKSLLTLLSNTKEKGNLLPSIRKQYAKYAWEEELLWYEGRIVVPEVKGIRLCLLGQHHNTPIASHQGQVRTLELISRPYYWPGMKAQVNRYMSNHVKYAKGAKDTNARYHSSHFLSQSNHGKTSHMTSSSNFWNRVDMTVSW
jgi:hypothetical protein